MQGTPESFASSFCRQLLQTIAGLALFGWTFVPESQSEVWTDSSGKVSLTATFLELRDDIVVLRDVQGRRRTIPLAKLNSESKLLAEKLGKKVAGAPVAGVMVSLDDANDLEKLALRQRTADRALHLYKQYLSKPALEPTEKEKAEKRLTNWQERANNKLVRWGTRWEPVEQILQHRKDEEQLLSEAHRLMEINNDEMAREKFEEASATNTEEVRADFYLGILHLLVGLHSRTAVDHFGECIKRLELAEDRLTGARRSNLIAALNNRAICHVRNGDHAKALKDWSKAIKLSPLTPELIQNLGYYSQLVSVVPYWRVSKSIVKDVTDQYAHLSVVNEAAGFQDSVGWLVIPYVDAPSLPDFENADLIDISDPTLAELLEGSERAENDLRVVGWATAVAVDQDHLLTSRYAIQGAQGLWVRRDGTFLKDKPGKVVALAGSFDLALVRVRGLAAQAMPLETTPSTRGMDVRLASYAEPGILQDGMQVTKGTIVDLESVYVPLGNQYLVHEVAAAAARGDGHQTLTEKQSHSTVISLPLGVDYVTGLVHDASLNIGSAGSAVINGRGKIVGIDAGRRSLADANRHLAVNHTEIRQFLQSTGIPFSQLDHQSSAPIGDIEEHIRAAADKSVFQIAIVSRVPRLSWSNRIGESVAGITKLTNWNAYEDDNCIRCHGKGEIACRNRGCVSGRIGTKVTEQVGALPATGKPIYETHWEYDPCPTCSGKGFIRCEHCGGDGREPSIRN